MAMDSPDFVLLSSDQTLTLRETHISGACKLHFGQKPVKIVRSEAQFLYDDTGQKYLDCTSRTTNVGHCHPETVRAACNQFMKLTVCNEHPSNKIENRLDYEYCQELLSTLPDNFQVCLFTNSGAEANDLALKLARNYTGKNDVVVVDGSFHGAVNLLWDISPKTFKQFHPGKPPWVHVVPCPDMYRGPYAGHPDAAEKYFQQAKAAIDLAVQRNASIGCFLSEPVFIVHGVLIPPPGWLKRVYSYIRELGGVVIADEIQCGLGRSGSHFWAFQTQDAIPDILTLGKPLGNGHPVGCVVTSKKIAASLWPEDKSTYECNPVAAEVGLAVLRLMQRENFMENSFLLGLELTHGFRSIQPEHTIIGDVRGLGLMVAVDIVWTQESKKPAPELAEVISYRMKDEYILVANEGEYGNVLFFITPLCVTSKDIQVVIQVFHKIVTDVETSNLSLSMGFPGSSSGVSSSSSSLYPMVQSWPESDDSDSALDSYNYHSMD
nr:PREDICTED: 5-phosphohydroxy-L-lysine phospho-lyase-like isoform X2 [Bemisia tabaci]